MMPPLLCCAAVVLATTRPVRASECTPDPAAPTYAELPAAQQDRLNEIERRTFEFFWHTANPANGLVPDHWPGPSFSSIAAVGFGLTAYGIGAERGWVTRAQAAKRTLATLKFFANSPQNASAMKATGYRGFYYHFLDMQTGLRWNQHVELSSIDSALLFYGVLFAESYYDHATPVERKIRTLARQIFARADWKWFRARPPRVTMAWYPGKGFGGYDWEGYNEAMFLYVLALGSPTHALKPDAWQAWTSTYARNWGAFHGYTFENFAPMFGHQYSEAWIDFRGIKDAWGRAHDLTYFANSRCAARAQRAYAIANPGAWTGYGADLWGLTASNGPGDFKRTIDGRARTFHSYWARGAGRDGIYDDGTIAPTAAIGSIVFAPKIVLAAIDHMLDRYGKAIYRKYGFIDAFNPTLRDPDAKIASGHIVPGVGWVAGKYLGIDQGPILLMLENYRSGFVWNVMRRNPVIRRGLERAGFTGGWLKARHAGTDKAAPTMP